MPASQHPLPTSLHSRVLQNLPFVSIYPDNNLRMSKASTIFLVLFRNKFGQFLTEFTPGLRKIFHKLENSIDKINRHKMSVVFHNICLKENFTPSTHIHRLEFPYIYTYESALRLRVIMKGKKFPTKKYKKQKEKKTHGQEMANVSQSNMAYSR